nr:DUF4865 family protein [uncultured Shinella sp.]
MIAMQYRFTLPADYDMSIIDRRVAENGGKMDGFPDLGFKAYLIARKGEPGSPENAYAPFYLWKRPQGMEAFLTGPGFRGVTAAFGWPDVATWLVWQSHMAADIALATHAIQRRTAIPPYSDLAELRQASADRIVQLVEQKALTTVSAFDPKTWSLVEFSLWKNPAPAEQGDQIFRVGHVSS